MFLLTGFILIGKAMHLQLIDTSFQNKASTTTIGKDIIYPSRGVIYDRHGHLLINNNAMYDLMVTYNQLDPNMDTAKFCRLLRITPEVFRENLDKDFKRDVRFSKSKPYVFLKTIPSEVFAGFQEHLHQFPGFFPQLRNVRGYPYKSGAHVLGFMNEVNPTILKEKKGEYALGDYIGATGLEYAYEGPLRGRKGHRYILKDNLGRVVGPYLGTAHDSLPAISGANLVSSLDINLQAYGEELMRNKTGSIVAIEPASGDILAMVSMPTYDPNLMVINRDRGITFQKLLNDTLQPFFDRTVMAKYPPGSIFKTVVALVGMQEGVMHANTAIGCQGAYFYKNLRRGCHLHPHAYNVSIALQHSCNSYFFNVLRRIVDKDGFYNAASGLNTFEKYVRRFGLGQTLGVDYPNEDNGNVPTSAYYDRLYPKDKGGWKSPTIMSIGIGQGEIEMTTLQMANLAAIMANRGYYYTPHLINSELVIDQNGKRQTKNISDKTKVKHDVGIDTRHFDPVVLGMAGAVNGGTAKIAQIKGIQVCGKTGTSQNPHGDDHSVFFAFAPMDDPKIAIAVYVEHGVWGARYAAPIASLMIEKYLKKEIDPSRNALEEKMLNADLISLP